MRWQVLSADTLPLVALSTDDAEVLRNVAELVRNVAEVVRLLRAWPSFRILSNSATNFLHAVGATPAGDFRFCGDLPLRFT